jgi:glycosidase
MNAPKSIAEIDFASLIQRQYMPSPDCWADQILYFLMLDRFSDGNERGGYRDSQDQPVTTGTTPLATSGDIGSVPYWQWLSEAPGWQGGTLKGLNSKLGLTPAGSDGDLDQSRLQTGPFEATYHGYGIQNFLDVDPHFGTSEDLRDLVDAAHRQGIYCILDVILNRAGDVFGYRDARYQRSLGEDKWVPDARWDGQPYQVEGFRNRDGEPVLPFDPPDRAALDNAWPDGAISPRELQDPAVSSAKAG